MIWIFILNSILNELVYNNKQPNIKIISKSKWLSNKSNTIMLQSLRNHKAHSRGQYIIKIMINSFVGTACQSNQKKIIINKNFGNKNKININKVVKIIKNLKDQRMDYKESYHRLSIIK